MFVVLPGMYLPSWLMPVDTEQKSGGCDWLSHRRMEHELLIVCSGPTGQARQWCAGGKATFTNIIPSRLSPVSNKYICLSYTSQQIVCVKLWQLIFIRHRWWISLCFIWVTVNVKWVFSNSIVWREQIRLTPLSIDDAHRAASDS